MATVQAKSSNGRGGLFSRLHDWWEGTDPNGVDGASEGYDALDGDEQFELDADAAGDGRENTARVWTKERIAAVQLVCGEGSSTPGGERIAKQALKPLGLNETMSVLVYGCQLGLFARATARETGAWVDGIDTEPLLVEEAVRLSMVHNLSKKAAIRQAGLDDKSIKDGSRDAVIAVEAFHRHPDLTTQLQGIVRVLKPTGQVLLVDFVSKTEGSTPALDLWRAYEPVPPTVCDVEELRKALKKFRLKVRITADITDEYVNYLTQGLQGMAKQLIKHPPESAMHLALLREVHYWGRRLAVLNAGDLGVVRMIAAMSKE
jgi:cyclopropane fatty-acyl-phospholipid synthase-like methyltransferase